MRYSILPGLVLLLLSSLTNNAYAVTRHWPVELFDVMDNHTLVIFLGDEDISKSPKWMPSEGRPPLTIEGALKYAREWISHDSSLSKAKVHEIELKPVHNHEKEHSWYYLIQLHTTNNNKTTAHYIAILFNGKVVPAIVKPTSYK